MDNHVVEWVNESDIIIITHHAAHHTSMPSCRPMMDKWWLILILLVTGLLPTVLSFTIPADDAFSFQLLPRFHGHHQHHRLLRSRLFSSPSSSTTISSWKDRTRDLPVTSILSDLQQAVQETPNTLLEAPPGAGKTTVVPLALLNLPLSTSSSMIRHILVVEPRRVAVRAAAHRLSDLWGTKSRRTIGYAMRGDSMLPTNPDCSVTVMTDGVLLQRLRKDPSLTGIDLVIFDEFHERGLLSDTALALCREGQLMLRNDDTPLRLVVMSATLLGEETGIPQSTHSNSTGPTAKDSSLEPMAAKKLLRALGGDDCRIVKSEGRQYPVEMQWSSDLDWKRSSFRRPPPLRELLNRKTLVESMVIAIEQAIAKAPAQGDVLAFLPGAAEIRKTIHILHERGTTKRTGIQVLPLYGSLSKDEQDKAIFPGGASSSRRVIVSSPIAEASLTIKGVTCVVDSGLRRQAQFGVKDGLPRLVTVHCSQASATQRAGRAGRLQEGLCIRLYSSHDYDTALPAQAPPEIASADLSGILLLLAERGCTSLEEILTDLPFVDAPPRESLEKAVQLLSALGAIDTQYQVGMDSSTFPLTTLGKKISRLPTHPRYATAMVQAEGDPARLAAVVATSYLMDDSTVQNQPESNLVTRVKDLFRDNRHTKRLLQHASRMSREAAKAVEFVLSNEAMLKDVLTELGRALLPGFLDLVSESKGDASYGGSSYFMAMGHAARLDDVVNGPKYIVAVATTTGDDTTTRIRAFVAVDQEDLLEYAVTEDIVYTVPSRGYEVKAKRSRQLGKLSLSSSPLPAVPTEKKAQVLSETIHTLGGYAALPKLLPPDQQTQICELCSRVKLARETSPNVDQWPGYFEQIHPDPPEDSAELDAFLEQIVEPWLVIVDSVKRMDLLAILQGELGPEQRRHLDELYPTKIEAPDGSFLSVQYSTHNSPVAMAAPQQFFGTNANPIVGPPERSTPVTLHLTSPAGRVQAQTSDLDFFWKETYPSVRAEMRGKYPKHPWPEDPMDATPTRLTKKQQKTQGEQTKQPMSGTDNTAKKRKKRGKRGKRR